jgi:hypothetical protein
LRVMDGNCRRKSCTYGMHVILNLTYIWVS